MAIIDHFPATLAVTENGVVVRGAEAQVYAMADTTFANPLPLTDLQGVPMAKLVSSPMGIYPPFRVTTGELQVVVRSGTLLTPMTSIAQYVAAAEAAAARAEAAESTLAGRVAVFVQVITGNEPRPAGAACVFWVGGSTRPANMAIGDIWFAEGEVTAPPTSAPAISTTTLNPMTVGVAFSQILARTGSTPITFARTGGALPDGITLNGTTGALAGTPTTVGSYSFTITATNSAGSTSRTYTGSVSASGGGGGGKVIPNSGTWHTSGAAVGTDGGGSLESGNHFYATKNIRVLGARIYIPAGASGAILTEALTVKAYGRDWTGGVLPFSVASWGSALQTKTLSTARTAGSWTDVLFDAPIAMSAVAAGANSPDVILLTCRSASGNLYVFTPSGNAAPEESADNGGDVYLAEQGFPRGANNAGGGQNSGAWYGIDLIWENA
ncbi:Ig domain-containing protein [Microbacterium sp. NPDC058021]|uniref:Ig domain-containing protein n=1 Tax=Microbacterium sp. NPDC058021 TaxID=3346306 RepID=UPI0036DDB1B3